MAQSLTVTDTEICTGCEDAVWELHQVHRKGLLRYVRTRVFPRGHPIRRRVDPEDVAQDAWLALLSAIDEEERCPFQSHEELARFLQYLAHCAGRNEFRTHIGAAKRSLLRLLQDDLAQNRMLKLQSDQPDPSAEIAAAEEVQKLVDSFERIDGDILVAMLDGSSVK